MIIKAKFLLLIAVPLLLCACKKSESRQAEKPLARVLDKYLYPSDLEGVVPAGVSGNDSTSVVNDFIEKWILNQLLLEKAEKNLTYEEKDVEKQIENYRSSLLIYAYQQSYIQQKLDTIVNDKEIEEYFKDNQSNFVLNEPLMKGTFIKVPANAPDLYKLRQWYRSDDTESNNSMEGYCFKHAAIYDHFNENWVNLNEVIRMIPGISPETVKNRKYLESRDNGFYYFLSIKEFADEGTVSPFDLVKNDIHYIILNKRKVKLISELEASLYSDAQNRDNFTIYK